MSMNVNTTGTVYGSYQNTYKAGTVSISSISSILISSIFPVFIFCLQENGLPKAFHSPCT